VGDRRAAEERTILKSRISGRQRAAALYRRILSQFAPFLQIKNANFLRFKARFSIFKNPARIFEKSLDKGHSACYYEHMNKRSYDFEAKGDTNMAETKDAKPAAQPEGLDMPDDEVLYELADLFRVFGDSTRIKILYALHDNELCVQDIANAVALSQSAVSHQLRVLKDSKLVRFRREGKTVYYALDDDHVRSILSMGMDHIEE